MWNTIHISIDILNFQGPIQADAIEANANAVQKIITDAIIGQIFSANNEKLNVLQKHKA